MRASSPTLSCKRLCFISAVRKRRKCGFLEFWGAKVSNYLEQHDKSLVSPRLSQAVLSWARVQVRRVLGCFMLPVQHRDGLRVRDHPAVQPPEAKGRGSRWGFSRTFLTQLFPTGELFSQEPDPVHRVARTSSGSKHKQLWA